MFLLIDWRGIGDFKMFSQHSDALFVSAQHSIHVPAYHSTA